MDKIYLELLRNQRELELKGKIFAKENQKAYKILIKYEVNLWDHFEWENRQNFSRLIEDLLTRKISIDQYIKQLFEINSKTQSLIETLKLDFETLKKFEPNPASKGFSKFIEQLNSDCRIFEPNPDLQDEFEISEEELRHNAEEIFFKIQEYF